MKINGNDIKTGNIIQHKNALWIVMKTQHVKPGKGGAFTQIECKNIITGSKLNERFRSSERIERVRLEQKEYQFLYQDDNGLHFMDTQTYEQTTLPSSLMGERAHFLQDGLMVMIDIYEGKPIGCTLPKQISCIIKETEPALKGQTAANTNKPAILDNGARLMVPSFINEGDKVMIDTETLAYIKRADE